MSAGRAAAGPLAAGLLAAAAAFTVVALATSGGTADSDVAGPAAARRASQPPRARGSEPARGLKPSLARGSDPTALRGHDEGRAVFARMGCGSCHRLAAAGSDGGIGPDLDERLAHHTRASLTAKVLDPSQGAGEGFSVMPDDFGSRLTGDELEALVDFLLAARRAR
jgi:hypothetical protein